jgi:Na+/melibiose symporter-like transporter
MITAIAIIVAIIVGAFWINALIKYHRMKKARKEYREIERKLNRLN